MALGHSPVLNDSLGQSHLYLLDEFRGQVTPVLLDQPRGEGMQSVGYCAVLDPQGQVGEVHLHGPLEAVQNRQGVLPDWPVTLQLVRVQLVLNAAGSGQRHTGPRIKPAP